MGCVVSRCIDNNNIIIYTRSELALLAHLYACIKLHINDCAVVTSLGSRIRPCCGAVRLAKAWVRTCTSWQIMWLFQSASHETRYSSSCFAHKKFRHKLPRTDSPTSTKYTWAISSLVPRPHPAFFNNIYEKSRRAWYLKLCALRTG